MAHITTTLYKTISISDLDTGASCRYASIVSDDLTIDLALQEQLGAFLLIESGREEYPAIVASSLGFLDILDRAEEHVGKLVGDLSRHHRDDTKLADEAEDLLFDEPPFVPLADEPFEYDTPEAVQLWPVEGWQPTGIPTPAELQESFDLLTDEHKALGLSTIVNAAGGDIIQAIEAMGNAVRILSGPFPRPKSGEFALFRERVIALDKIMLGILLPTPDIAQRIEDGEKLW